MGLSLRVLNWSMVGVLFISGCEYSPGSPSCAGCDIILVTADTLRADHLGSYGYSHDTSPRIDAFAEESITFENAVAQSCWTAPSLLSLMSSKVFSHLRRDNPDVRYDNLRLPEIFRKNGYKTAAFVSHPALRKNLERGFELYDDSQAEGKDGVSSEGLTNSAIEWMNRQGEEKFFAWVHYFDPHTEYIPPAPFDERFTGTYSGRLHKGFPASQVRGRFWRGALEEADIDFVTGLYDGEIAYTDHHIGRLLTALETLNGGSTIIVFAADHGEELGERRTIAQHRTSVFQEQVHTPLVLRYPGVEASRIALRVGNMDIAPTVLGLAGLETPSEFDGVNLLGLSESHPIVTECDFIDRSQGTRAPKKLAALYEGRMKVIYDFEDEGVELYDLASDPGEQSDLSTQAPERTARQVERLLGYLLSDEQGRAYYGKGGVSDFDEETLRKLRGLGYLN